MTQMPLDQVASAEDVLEAAKKAFILGDFPQVFELTSQVKAARMPCEDTDYLRALYFQHRGETASALEALREELRYFPQNQKAMSLLAALQPESPAETTLGDEEFRELYKTVRPYSMLSEKRLFSLFSLAKKLCEENVPGNFVECGVAAGGASALLGYVIKRYSKQPRWVYALDTFSGMPEPTEWDRAAGVPANNTGWSVGTCAAPESSLRDICNQLRVSTFVKPIAGEFSKTLPARRDWIGMIAFLHLDADWYESTRLILENLYERISDNGILQVDDFGHWEGCKKAILEFAAGRKISFDVQAIDYTGVWFRKPDRFSINPFFRSEMVAEFLSGDAAQGKINSQMSVNERFQMHYVVRQCLPVTSETFRFLEIGSFAGASLLTLYEAFLKTGRPFSGICVEPGGLPSFYDLLRWISNEVRHVKGKSSDVIGEVKTILAEQGDGLDLLFIDGNHSYEVVLADIQNYFPLLKKGGIVLLHDYLPEVTDVNREAIFFHHNGATTGVKKACDEYFNDTAKAEILEIPLLYPKNPAQTQAHLPLIPEVFSTMQIYRKK